MDTKVPLKDKIAHKMISEDKPLHIKEIAEEFPGIPESTVRGRLNDNVWKLFNRVWKWVYVLAWNQWSVCLVNGDARKLDDKFDENSMDLIISDHAWLDEKSHKWGNRSFASTYDCFKYEDEDFNQKIKTLKPGGFLVEFLPEKNANNKTYLREIEDMAEKAWFKYFAEVNITWGNSNIGRKKKFISTAYFFTKGEARKLKVWDEKLSKMIKEGDMPNMKKEYMVDFKKVYSEVMTPWEAVDRTPTNFDLRISREEANFILNSRKKWNKEFTGFDIMCKEYGQDDDWEEVNTDDLEEWETEGVLEICDDYETLEVYFDDRTCADKEKLIESLNIISNKSTFKWLDRELSVIDDIITDFSLIESNPKGFEGIAYEGRTVILPWTTVASHLNNKKALLAWIKYELFWDSWSSESSEGSVKIITSGFAKYLVEVIGRDKLKKSLGEVNSADYWALNMNFYTHIQKWELPQFKKFKKTYDKYIEIYHNLWKDEVKLSEDEEYQTLKKEVESFYDAISEYVTFLQAKDSFKMGSRTILPEVFMWDNLSKNEKRHESQKPQNTLEEIILQTTDSWEDILEQFAWSFVWADAVLSLWKDGKWWRNYIWLEIGEEKVDAAKAYLQERHGDIKIYTVDDFYKNCKSPDWSEFEIKGWLQQYKKLEVVKEKINVDLKDTVKLCFLQFSLVNDSDLQASNFESDSWKLMTISFSGSKKMNEENRVLSIFANKEENIFEIRNRTGKIINKTSPGTNLDASLIKLYNNFV